MYLSAYSHVHIVNSDQNHFTVKFIFWRRCCGRWPSSGRAGDGAVGEPAGRAAIHVQPGCAEIHFLGLAAATILSGPS
jgi:hypothetical protein